MAAVHVSKNQRNTYAPELAPSDDPEVVPEENLPEAVNATWFAASKHLLSDHTVKPKPPTPTRNKRRLLFVLLALGVIVVIGVALGVGLGLGLKTSHSAPNPSTSAPIAVSPFPSTSNTTQSAVPSDTTGIAAIPCTENDVGVSSNYTLTQNQINTVFTKVCNTDWPGGSELSTGSGIVEDLQRVVKYTFDSCMDACALFNANLRANDEPCTAVVYNWNLASSVVDQGGNCFLKNGRGKTNPVCNYASAYVFKSNGTDAQIPQIKRG